MKKKVLAASFMAFGAFAFSLCTLNANAATNDIVTKDEFVFDANNLTSNYSAGASLANNNGVSLKLGNNYAGDTLRANFDFGDYSFQYGLLAKEDNSNNIYSYFRRYFGYNSSNQNLAQYYISAEEGTKCGFYYTVVDKEAKDNTYYVSNNNSIKFIKEKKNNKYDSVGTVTEQLDYMYYSEFTFGNQGTVGLMSDTQYIVLFGVTLVTEVELENRDNTNEAINALIDYYNTNGVSTSALFTELVNNAKDSISNVNHISQIPNYDEYQTIITKYDELVNVETKINSLINTNARAYALNIKYDAATKVLLDEIAEELTKAYDLGISNEEISNYGIYENALNLYNNLEQDYYNAQGVIELINNLGEVEYTDAYKAQLDAIQVAYDQVNDLSLITNAEEFLAKKAAFEELSNATKEAFTNKVAEANEVKGETSSYTLINEAEELYNALIDSDKESVADDYNTLEEVKNAYNEYQESVTENDFVTSYNEDGSIKRIIFVGTINNFTSCEDIKEIRMYIVNETANETNYVVASLVYTSIRIGSSYSRSAQDGVRYIYTIISNSDGKYSDCILSMYYEVEYKDGHIVSSNTESIEVR